jgi:PleD family two-component response regulator
MDIEKSSLIPDRKVIVGIGVAGQDSDFDWKQWMNTYDKNLYNAKNSGLNKVVINMENCEPEL